MIYPSGDKIEEKIDSKYSLVIAVSKRAKQLKEGAPKLIETKSTNPITVALEEIAAGKIQIATYASEEPGEQSGTYAQPARQPVDKLNVTDIDDLLLDETDVDEVDLDEEVTDLSGELEDFTEIEDVDEDSDEIASDLLDEDIDMDDLGDHDEDSEEL